MDTLFNNIRSKTRILTVRNNSDNDISISNVRLERGIDSKYQLNIDGTPNNSDPILPSAGKVFENVEILANDSIFIFIETTVDPAVDDIDTNGNYTDKIVFDTNNAQRKVHLLAQVIDANFSFSENPTREFITEQRDEQGEFITLKAYDFTDEELNITRDKAQVIFGYAVVPANKTMTINAGSRLYFHRSSGIIVEDGATLNIIGEDSPEDDDENPFLNDVIIEGNQIDDDFDNLPAQWDFIWIQKGASATLTNTIIKNATTGLFIQGNGAEVTPNLLLTNVQIYNSQTVGIQAESSTIEGTNVVINQTGRGSLNIENGGTYSFTHSTFSNTFNFGSPNQTSIVANNIPKEGSTNTNLQATFTNCIITGNKRDEITVTNNPMATFSLFFENCLINFASSNTNSELDTMNASIFSNCIFNEDPLFKNTRLNMLEVDEESAGNGKAKFIDSKDIIGTDRTNPSDIGAYETITFKQED